VTIPFLEARWYTEATGRRIDFIVIHDMEMAEKGDTAESCAQLFHTTDRKASAHYCVDADSIVQCVREKDIAYHAPPNTHSIGVEHAGFAGQTRTQWLDEYGVAMLTRSAGLVAELLKKYDLPLAFLSPDDLRAGKRGITTHANVSKAWGQTTHTDPGPDFPVGWYTDRVREALQEDDMTWDELSTPDAWFIDTARRAVEAELGDENVGAFSDRIVQKVIAALPAAPAPSGMVDVDALATAVADKLAARLAQ
jgi:N-acetyl-anhydromuramyl-L-alanine amidase AmpD